MNFPQVLEQGEALLQDICKGNKPLLIYGTGSIANFMYGALQEEVGIQGFCVSNPLWGGGDTFSGLPVFGVTQLGMELSRYRLLVAVDKRHWQDITCSLNTLGIQDIVWLSVAKQNAVLAKYYTKYLHSKGVDCSQSIVDFGGVLLKNPFFLEGVDLDAVLIEMNDLILGDIYKNYALLSEGPYLYDAIQLAPNDIVLDCGANLGIFSCVAASKGCTSYAFEPTRRVYEELLGYSAVYGERLRPVNLALSDACGEAQFAMSDKWDVANTLVLDENNTILDQQERTTYVTVQTTTVDEFVRTQNLPRVDFIKADIEGSERLMLKGAQDTLRRFAPKLSICTYHFADDPQVLEQLVLAANPHYRIIHRWKKLYAYVP